MLFDHPFLQEGSVSFCSTCAMHVGAVRVPIRGVTLVSTSWADSRRLGASHFDVECQVLASLLYVDPESFRLRPT